MLIMEGRAENLAIARSHEEWKIYVCANIIRTTETFQVDFLLGDYSSFPQLIASSIDERSHWWQRNQT